MHTHYIYRIVNSINGKFYIGMHSCSDLKNCKYMGSGKKLQRAKKKYGPENFKKEILEFLPDRKSLIKREEEIINKDLLDDPMCMNLKYGGEGNGTFGFKFSEESKNKMSKWKRTPDMKDKMAFSASKRAPITEEHSKILSDAFTGRRASDETKRKMSNVRTGKSINQPKRGIDKIIECPHCQVSGGQRVMKRHHFDNCYSKPGNETIPKRKHDYKNTIYKSKKLTCPYCNKTGGTSNMIRYHFENCKLNPSFIQKEIKCPHCK